MRTGMVVVYIFFFSSRRRHTRFDCDWSQTCALPILRIIQKLDPPGVGARDLRECLLLQLEARGETGTLAYRLVREAFEGSEERRVGEEGRFRGGADH